MPSYPTLSPPSKRPTSFALVLFPGFQLLDACGPLDLLNTLAETEHELSLSIWSTTLDPVPTKHPSVFDENPRFSESIKPTHTFAQILESQVETDVVIIPGGTGTRIPKDSILPTLEFLKSYLSSGYLKHSIFTICTGSRLLAQTGYLDTLKATTNKRAFDVVADLFPQVKWVRRARWVRDGEVWTTSGVSAGMDGMVAFIATWWGEEKSRKLCWNLEYRWCGWEGREKDEFADNIE